MTIKIGMKAFVFSVLAAAAVLSVAQTPAAYPVKPITMNVPFPPSGVTELVAREFVKRLSDGVN